MTRPTPPELAEIGLFARLDEPNRTVLAGWLDVEEAESGRRLTHQGAYGYAFFILVDGAADVIVDGTTVRTLGPGDFFGEISMVGPGQQTATVQVTVPSTVWTMFGTRFRELQMRYPEVAAELADAARERLHRIPGPTLSS
jgi:CRP-like cAMP-binding protein